MPLQKRPSFRQIKRHPFFGAIDWDAIARKQVKPPARPLTRMSNICRRRLDSSCSSESTTSTTTTTLDDSRCGFV